MLSFSVISRITLQGTPAAKELAGISLVTTDPAPITAPSPMVTPGVITELDPIHTSFPITTGAGYRSARRAGSIAWFRVAMTVL